MGAGGGAPPSGAEFLEEAPGGRSSTSLGEGGEAHAMHLVGGATSPGGGGGSAPLHPSRSVNTRDVPRGPMRVVCPAPRPPPPARDPSGSDASERLLTGENRGSGTSGARRPAGRRAGVRGSPRSLGLSVFSRVGHTSRAPSRDGPRRLGPVSSSARCTRRRPRTLFLSERMVMRVGGLPPLELSPRNALPT